MVQNCITRPPRGLERVSAAALLALHFAKCVAAMAQQTASLKAFVNTVNRLLEVACKLNQKNAASLFDDCCARERNFAKRILNDPLGSAALVEQARRGQAVRLPE